MAVQLGPEKLELVAMAMMAAKDIDEQLRPIQKKFELEREEALRPEIEAFQKEYAGSEYEKGGMLKEWEDMKIVIDEELAKVNPAPEAFQANPTVKEAVVNRTELHTPHSSSVKR